MWKSDGVLWRQKKLTNIETNVSLLTVVMAFQWAESLSSESRRLYLLELNGRIQEQNKSNGYIWVRMIGEGGRGGHITENLFFVCMDGHYWGAWFLKKGQMMMDASLIRSNQLKSLRLCLKYRSWLTQKKLGVEGRQGDRQDNSSPCLNFL